MVEIALKMPFRNTENVRVCVVENKNIWIIHYQEPPIEVFEGKNRRLWRSNSLAEELARQGHNVFRWRSSFNHYKKLQMCQRPKMETIYGVKQIYIPTTGYRAHRSLKRIISHYFLGRGFCRVIEHLNLEDPDVIHVCNVPPELLKQVFKYARNKSIPVVLDVRDLWPEAYANIIPSRFKWARQIIQRTLVFLSFRYRQIIREVDALTTISDALMDYLVTKYRRHSIENDKVFHIGATHTAKPVVGGASIKTEILDDFDSDPKIDEPLRLIYAGNIGFQTDFDRIISLNRILEEKKANVEIKICGDGPRLEELTAKTSSMENITFTGWLDGDQYREQLDKADFGLIYFFPNLDFQLSIPSKVSEYLCSTKGLLSISAGSVRALISEHRIGLDCHTMSDHEIADLLSEYSSDRSELNNFSINARELYREKFSQKEITKKMAAHLLSLLETKKHEKKKS